MQVTCFLKNHTYCRAGGEVMDGPIKDIRNLLRMMKMFCILIVVVVSWVHMSLKIYPVMPSNCTIELNYLLYANYNSIKVNFDFLVTVWIMNSREQE